MMDAAWWETLSTVYNTGEEAAPRGMATLEQLHGVIKVDMMQCVLTNPLRKLNYRFMAAEALWILMGDNRVAPLVEHNKRMAEFSDDGVILAGAYGPRIADQLLYVVDKLAEDPHTRQAVLTTWVPNPRPSKDIPCTIALDFKLRHGKLNCHVFMRSSDVWLGLPYDIFAFSMVTSMICSEFNLRAKLISTIPGQLFLTASSSHLYSQHWQPAKELLQEPPARSERHLPYAWLASPGDLITELRELTTSSKGDHARWWE